MCGDWEGVCVVSWEGVCVVSWEGVCVVTGRVCVW